MKLSMINFFNLIKTKIIFMKKLSLLLVLFSLTFFIGCEESSETTVVPHVSFENDRVFDVEIDGSSTSEIKVYATQESNVDRVFNLVVDADLTTLDPAAYTLPATVTIPANSRIGSFNLTVSDLNLDTQKVLAIAFDGLDGVYTGAPLLLTAKQFCPFNDVVFSLILDRYGDETSWDITNQDGDVIDAGGPYTNSGVNALQPEKTFTYCLPAGTYTFTIYDAYSDGLVTSATVVGSYKMIANGTVLFAQPGNFTDSRSHTFVLN